MSKSILIIGSGIAGLAAGCYGQMNGYDTQIFELHDKPGGLCTAWKRKGYVFDGCIHWLVGSKDGGGGMNQMWQELGAVQGRDMVDHEEYARVEGQDGRVFIVYTDMVRFAEHLKSLSPLDAPVIDEFCNTVIKVAKLSPVMNAIDPPSGLLAGLKNGMQMLPFINIMRKYGKISIHDFAARFSDPLLRQSFVALLDMPNFPIVGLMMMLAWMHNQDAGYPVGGSLAFSEAIAQRYLDLGGTLHYKARVEKILVENDVAVGIKLTDGTEHHADRVISAADGHATIFDMLEGKYLDSKVQGYYNNAPIFAPIIQVSLGVDRDMSDEPHLLTFYLDQPITIAGQTVRQITSRHFCCDPTIAPEGKSVVVVVFEGDYDVWKALSEDRQRYKVEKEQIADAVIAQLDKRFPGIKEQIEVVDVATPMTTERYTGNWRGSMEGWMLTTENIQMTVTGMRKTLPGLEKFYMAGQWVEPGGGVPTAAMSGRKAIQMICKEDEKTFVATLPE